MRTYMLFPAFWTLHNFIIEGVIQFTPPTLSPPSEKKENKPCGI